MLESTVITNIPMQEKEKLHCYELNRRHAKLQFLVPACAVTQEKKLTREVTCLCILLVVCRDLFPLTTVRLSVQFLSSFIGPKLFIVADNGAEVV